MQSQEAGGSFCLLSLQVIGCDLESVIIGIAEIDGMGNLVILELKLDVAPVEFSLRRSKIPGISAKSEVQHTTVVRANRGL